MDNYEFNYIMIRVLLGSWCASDINKVTIYGSMVLCYPKNKNEFYRPYQT